jgi:hypothetical protein
MGYNGSFSEEILASKGRKLTTGPSYWLAANWSDFLLFLRCHGYGNNSKTPISNILYNLEIMPHFEMACCFSKG